MASFAQGADRPVVLAAVRHLINEARLARAALDVKAPEREFYLGVEAAADEILHPELRDRAANWLDLQTRAFRSGYLRMSTSLAMTLTASGPPFLIRLPQPIGLAG